MRPDRQSLICLMGNAGPSLPLLVMRLIAARQLTTDAGTFTAGQEFDEAESIAKQLLASGVARRPGPPTVQYETKVITPRTKAPEVSPRQPFRDGGLPDPKQTPMAAEGDSVFYPADVSPQGTIDSGRRRERPGSGPGR